MIRVAAGGHRDSACGQGAELCWARAPEPLSAIEVLDIFRQKTAPAFEVALRLGALYAGEAEEVRECSHAYSEALGIAYQIRDDLDDLDCRVRQRHRRDAHEPAARRRLRAGGRPTRRLLLESAWRRLLPDGSAPQIAALCLELNADERARALLDAYKEQAIRSLQDLENANLKGLLRRVVGKIFNDTEIKGWCKEFEAVNKVGAE